MGQEALTASATALSTTAWVTATRPPALAKNASRPGQAKVYPGEVGEWVVPLSAYRKAAGRYPLSFQATGPDGAYGPVLRLIVTVAAPR